MDQRKITVTCGVASGIVLRNFDMKDVSGQPTAIPGAQIELRYGDNPDVDGEQFDKWMESNKDSDLVRSGLVFSAPELPEEGRRPLEPSNRAAIEGAPAGEEAKPEQVTSDPQKAGQRPQGRKSVLEL
jgi:hypothetical protein